MRPDEQAAAEAANLAARFVEVMHGVERAAETPRRGSRRASVHSPDRPAILVDGDAVRTAPCPVLDGELRPVANDAIRVGAAVHWWLCISLRSAASLLRVHGSHHGARDDGVERGSHFQLSIALACSESGGSSASSMRPM